MRAARLILACAFIAGCGSGSNGGGGTQGNVMLPQPVPGAATVQIRTQGPSPDTVLYAAQFTLRFPAAISLPVTQGSEMLPAGVLQTAAGSYAGASYLGTATGTAPVIRVNITHPTGITVGPLATVNCTLASGATVSASDIALEDFSARDLNGAPISGITTTLAVQTQ